MVKHVVLGTRVATMSTGIMHSFPILVSCILALARSFVFGGEIAVILIGIICYPSMICPCYLSIKEVNHAFR